MYKKLNNQPGKNLVTEGLAVWMPHKITKCGNFG